MSDTVSDTVTREGCRICDGTGKLFVRQMVGFLGQVKEVTINCWACKGRGFIEYYNDDRGASPNGYGTSLTRMNNGGPIPPAPTTPP